MNARLGCLFTLAGLALVVAGCAENPPIRAYQTIPSLDLAMRTADVAVVGTVEDTEDLEHYPAGSIWSNALGKIGQDCVVMVRVSLRVQQVLKGPADLKTPLTFYFYGPCFHAEPGVLLGSMLPPVLTKDRRLKVFLQNQGGQYWLIAHARMSPESEAPAGPPVPPQM
jgi:hypothetical protein